MRILPLFNQAHSLLLSQRCVLCQTACETANRPLCNACFERLPRTPLRCYRCAIPLHSPGSLLCGECLQQPPAFTRTLATYDYDFPLNQLVLQFKYHRHLGIGSTLARDLNQQILSHYTDQSLPDALIAVPNHWLRQLRRGYNQAAWIALELKKTLRLPVLTAIKRHQVSQPQEGLNRKERKKNLKNAFICTQPKAIKGQHIALIDDVMTTGATAATLAELLLQNGAKRVDIWCIARTPRPNSRKA